MAILFKSLAKYDARRILVEFCFRDTIIPFLQGKVLRSRASIKALHKGYTKSPRTEGFSNSPLTRAIRIVLGPRDLVVVLRPRALIIVLGPRTLGISLTRGL